MPAGQAKVRRRAKNRCEYCQIPENVLRLTHVLDHIIARQHGGRATLDNMALACGRCNRFKGPHIAGLDPNTGKLTPLFHPRQHHWKEHFIWRGPILAGRTPIGRATIEVLAINAPLRIATRASVIEEGKFPPQE